MRIPLSAFRSFIYPTLLLIYGYYLMQWRNRCQYQELYGLRCYSCLEYSLHSYNGIRDRKDNYSILFRFLLYSLIYKTALRIIRTVYSGLPSRLPPERHRSGCVFSYYVAQSVLPDCHRAVPISPINIANSTGKG